MKVAKRRTSRTAMAIAFFIAIPAVLSGCLPTSMSHAGPPRDSVKGEPAPRSLRAPLGRWDVVAFDGYAPSFRMHGTERAAFADFTSTGVSLRLECNYTHRAGKFERGRFVVAPDSDNMHTMMGCGEEAHRRESQFFRFFDAEPQVVSASHTRLTLEAGEQTLELERPEERRLAFVPSKHQLLGTWQMMQITHYMPAGGSSGSGLSEIPGHLVITAKEMRHTACSALRLTYRMSEEGRLIIWPKSPGARGPVCPGLDTTTDHSYAPLGWNDAVSVLQAQPLAELSGNDLFLLAGEHGLLLSRVD